MRRKWIFLLAALVLAGCSGVTTLLQMQSFDESADRYRRAFRRSDFSSASHFVEVSPNRGLIEDPSRLKRFRITAYDVKNIKVYKDRGEVRQQVEIRYYSVKNPTERTIVDQQHWKYDAERDSWFLVSGLPALK